MLCSCGNMFALHVVIPVSDLGQLVKYSSLAYDHSFMSMVPKDDDHYNDLAISLDLQWHVKKPL